MKKQIKLLLLLTISYLLLGSCRPNKQTLVEKSQVDTMYFSNITILLDLSNRIDATLHPDQIKRDTLIISSILKNFSELVKRNGYIYSKDKIQVLIAPQAENKTKPFNPYIDVAEIANSGKIVRQVLPEYEKQFIKEVNEIYATKQFFSGADIYALFRDFAPETFVQKSYEEKSGDGSVYFKIHNKLIILTDGYLNFETQTQTVRCRDNSCMQMNKLRYDDDWKSNFSKYKLKPINGKDFQNLEVLMLEINPIHPEINVREFEIIDNYWKSWFREMKIGWGAIHQTNEGIPIVNSAIKLFLSNE